MAFPVLAVKTIAELAFTAVPLVERLIRGEKRGEEKKEAAVGYILEELTDGFKKAKAQGIPDLQNYKWIELLAQADEGLELIGDVVDAVVALMNFLNKFESGSGPKLVVS